MLPKSKRLTTKAFKNVIEKGQSFHSPFLVIRCIPHSQEGGFSVSVPKKVAKLAVSRNKIRRQVYSIVKKLESKIKPSFNSVIIMKVGSEKLLFEDLANEVQKAFVKSSLLK